MGRNPFHKTINPNLYTTGYTYSFDTFDEDSSVFFPWKKLDKNLFDNVISDFINTHYIAIQNSLIRKLINNSNLNLHVNDIANKIKINLLYSSKSEICVIFELLDMSLYDKFKNILSFIRFENRGYSVGDIIKMHKYNADFVEILKRDNFDVRISLEHIDTEIYKIFKEWFDKSAYGPCSELGLLS